MMKELLLQEINNSIEEASILSAFVEKNKDLDFSKNSNKILIGAAMTKRFDNLLKALHLSDVLKKAFDEDFTFPDPIQKELNQYTLQINTIVLSDNNVSYSKEIEEIITKMQNG